MMVDSSALVAILLAEAESERHQEVLATAPEALVPAPALTEAGMVMLPRTGPDGLTDLDDLLAWVNARVVPYDEAHARLAVEAFRRNGKGRHPAGLNFGDCMACAEAQTEGRPLLLTGEDFARTDVGAVGSGGWITHPTLATFRSGQTRGGWEAKLAFNEPPVPFFSVYPLDV